MATIVQEVTERIKQQAAKVIVGQETVIESMLVALFSRGHVLLEGVPGTAKTVMVKTLALALGGEFRRIQFTPDLMPSDIVGTNVFDMKTSTFHLKRGPIFTNLLLADEINRTPPKTQAALLEAMEERQVTIDGERHPFPGLFLVFATQNPIEYEGTYPLPEAQLDRFMLKILIDYPSSDEETEILRHYHQGFDAHRLDLANIEQAADEAQIGKCQEEIRQITVADSVFGYINQLVRQSRESLNTVLGGSPRASIALLLCGKALAAMRGREYVIPDDIKELALPVLRHRLILRPEAEIEGITADREIEQILAAVPVPR